MFNSKIVCCYLYPITKYGYPPDADGTFKYLEEMANLGFQSVELEGIREENIITVYNNRQNIKKQIDSLNLKLPYYCAVLPGLTSMDEKIRNLNIEMFEKGCETAAFFGAKGILDNAPLPPYLFPEGIPTLRHHDQESLCRAYLPDNFSWNYYWDMLIETFKNLCDIAANYDLTYQMHPAAGFLFSSTEGFLNLFEAVKRENLKFNFDTANLFVLKENLSLSLLRLKDHIDYIHISDNRGKNVEHLALGNGGIPWASFFETLTNIRFNGYFGIDIGGDESNIFDLDNAYKKSAEYLENMIIKLFGVM